LGTVGTVVTTVPEQSMVTVVFSEPLVPLVTAVAAAALRARSLLVHAVEMVTAQRLRLTIAVVCQKGGVGKSTLASNLGAAAHLSGLRTVILDPDPQGSLADWKAERPKGSKLDGLDVKPVGEELTEHRFHKLTAGYEVAILDGAPRLNDIARMAAMACDVAVIPLRVGGFNWWASEETLNLLDAVDKSRGKLPVPKPPVRRVFVLNEANDRTHLGQSAREALTKYGSEPPILVPSRTHYAAAATHGESVLTYADRKVPRGVPVREAPAAAEMWTLWRALSGLALGGNGHV
jgi:chromosome partitioning protein